MLELASPYPWLCSSFPSSSSSTASEKLTLDELLTALNEYTEVTELFERLLVERLQHAGFEGRPAEPRSPVQRVELPEEPNVTEDRFKEVLGHDGSREAKLVAVDHTPYGY